MSRLYEKGSFGRKHNRSPSEPSITDRTEGKSSKKNGKTPRKSKRSNKRRISKTSQSPVQSPAQSPTQLTAQLAAQLTTQTTTQSTTQTSQIQTTQGQSYKIINSAAVLSLPNTVEEINDRLAQLGLPNTKDDEDYNETYSETIRFFREALMSTNLSPLFDNLDSKILTEKYQSGYDYQTFCICPDHHKEFSKLRGLYDQPDHRLCIIKGYVMYVLSYIYNNHELYSDSKQRDTFWPRYMISIDGNRTESKYEEEETTEYGKSFHEKFRTVLGRVLNSAIEPKDIVEKNNEFCHKYSTCVLFDQYDNCFVFTFLANVLDEQINGHTYVELSVFKDFINSFDDSRWFDLYLIPFDIENVFKSTVAKYFWDEYIRMKTENLNV